MRATVFNKRFLPIKILFPIRVNRPRDTINNDLSTFICSFFYSSWASWRNRLCNIQFKHKLNLLVAKVNKEINLIISLIIINRNYQFCIICPNHLFVKRNGQQFVTITKCKDIRFIRNNNNYFTSFIYRKAFLDVSEKTLVTRQFHHKEIMMIVIQTY